MLQYDKVADLADDIAKWYEAKTNTKTLDISVYIHCMPIDKVRMLQGSHVRISNKSVSLVEDSFNVSKHCRH